MPRSDAFFKHRMLTRFLEGCEIREETAEKCADSILYASKLISGAFRSGGKVLLCGNGGSAADCQHLAGEFVCLLNKSFDRPALPAIALTTDSSILTAYSNDFGFEGAFARQVYALGKAGDVLIGISTSGNSKNVINAVKAAKLLAMRVVALIGEGGQLQGMDLDVVVSVPSSDTQYIQETHLVIEHILCDLVEHTLYGKSKDVSKIYGDK